MISEVLTVYIVVYWCLATSVLHGQQFYEWINTSNKFFTLLLRTCHVPSRHLSINVLPDAHSCICLANCPVSWHCCLELQQSYTGTLCSWHSERSCWCWPFSYIFWQILLFVPSTSEGTAWTGTMLPCAAWTLPVHSHNRNTRWGVSSSLWTVTAVWMQYEALYKHMKQAASNINQTSSEWPQYSPLLKNLTTIELCYILECCEMPLLN